MLAHEGGLVHAFGQYSYSFALASERAGEPVLVPAELPWSGKRKAGPRRTTFVNADSLGNLVEEAHRKIGGDLIDRWNRKSMLSDWEKREPTAEELRGVGLETFGAAEREAIRADRLRSGVYCGAPGGLKELRRCFFDVENLALLGSLGHQFR